MAREPDFGASLSLTTLACRLVTTDLVEPHEILSELGDPFHSFFRSSQNDALLGANYYQYSQILRSMPGELAMAADGQLFHERMHYWQAVGYPLLQWRFLHQLERLRSRLPSEKTYLFAGVHGGRLVESPQSLDATLALMDAEVLFEADAVEIVSEISFRGGGCVLQRGISRVQGARLPRGVLGLRADDGGIVKIPLDAWRLLEGAVTISELLLSNSDPEDMGSVVEKLDIDYWSAWILWDHLFDDGMFTSSEKMMMFLSAVDLALFGDVAWFIDVNKEDIDNGSVKMVSEMSVSDRFVRICLCARDLGPHLAEFMRGEHGGKRIRGVSLRGLVGVQAGLAHSANILPVSEVCGRNMVRLSRVVGQYLLLLDLGVSEDAKQAVVKISHLPASRWVEGLDLCEVIWRNVSERYDGTVYQIVGFNILATMCNFMISRFDQEAAHLVPGAFREMVERFPLPLVNLGGVLFTDFLLPEEKCGGDRGETLWDRSIHVTTPKVGFDLMNLVALAPLMERNANQGCGFIRHGQPACNYSSAGLGCPLVGIPPDAQRRRANAGIGDACHWTFARQKAGLTARGHPPAGA